MKAIFISLDGGLRWGDTSNSQSTYRHVVDVACLPKLGAVDFSKINPCETVKIQRREYERVGSGDGFDVYREVMR